MSEEAVGLKPGDVIQDTYEITRLLGEGGMGATFKGVNRATGHDVAIKVISSEFASNERAADLFRRESNLLRTVRADSVVGYETTIQDKTGRLFLIMEYVEGKSLADYIRKGARLGSADVLTLGSALADGLAAIHKLGIVHRDLAPDNVLVPGDDIERPKLIDFGVASNTIGTERTIIGDGFAGKISYAAPEQLGLFDGKVTEATDIYSMGLVLLRISGVKVPGEGKGMAGAIDARREDISLKDADLSPSLRRVLEAMLKANPSDRPADLPALFRDARAGAFDDETRVPVSRGDVKARSRMPLVGAAAVLALAVLGGGLWYVLTQPPERTPGSGSEAQAEAAAEAVGSDNPLGEAERLIAEGGTDNLNAALGALMALGQDESQPESVRQRSYIMVAEMYDPSTHDPRRSPFPSPNAAAAARFYDRAADLGSSEARIARDRLAE